MSSKAEALATATPAALDEPVLLERLLALTPDRVALVALETGEVLYANRSLGEALGHAPGDAEGLAACVHPPDREAFDAHRAALRTLGEGEALTLVARVRHADGTPRWLEVRDAIYRRGQDGGVQVLRVVRDVSEARRDAKALREREALHRLLAEGAQAMVCRHAADGTYAYVSSASVDLLGAPPESLVGTDPRTHVHPLDRESVPEGAFSGAEPGARPRTFIARMQHAAGHYVWVETVLVPMENAGGEVVLSTSRDVTRRMEASAARARERALLEAIFDALPDPTLVTDPQRRIVRVSRSVARTFGYEPDELLGRTAEPLYAHSEEFEATGRRYFHPTTRLAETQFPARYRRKGGEEFDGETSAGVVRDESGLVLGYLGIVRDVSDRLAMLRDLEAANAELAQFAYVASHDLQAPLRSIMGFGELLADELGDEVDGDARRYLDRVVTSAARMRDLILSLLEYSRAGDGDQPFALVSLGSVLATCVQDLPDDAGARVVLPDSLPTVLGDATQLQRVFANLLSNALKFRRPDVPAEVRVEGRRLPRQRVEVTVADNGIGIAEEDFARVFKVFQRLHTRSEFPGDGIGLAIVRRIVERHGGRVELRSAVGRGSTFRVVLRAAG
ncbi:MAG: PAS domain S-box protein [Myxococcota bacterium]